MASDSSRGLAWVRDEEVTECQLCSTKFSVVVRKHHCRACGRVVCGNCSDNTMYVPSLQKRERVCDPCCETLRHEKTLSLSEKRVEGKKESAWLKANLQERAETASWFREFLAGIQEDVINLGIVSGDEPAAESTSPFTGVVAGDDIAPTSSDDSDDGEASSGSHSFDGDTNLRELQTPARDLVNRGRRHWRAASDKLVALDAEAYQLHSDIDTMHQETKVHAERVVELKKLLKSTESDLQRRSLIEAERNHLKVTIAEQEKELHGLMQRASILESGHSSLRVGIASPALGQPTRRGGRRERRNCSMM
eukprot:TRINITY_DN64928_c0_g1_i1.p1 TRINITY_DN64928_c0_g1~~TRINITY_DN64928_c0_g1_i1.p1  ORF type:complete len:308 (+),score=55.39 TRINITY_DN64928_c0_g1_i1:57-980(+)